jgi:hypothetical protein
MNVERPVASVSPPALRKSRESRCVEHRVITGAATPAAQLAFDGDQFECRAAVGAGERRRHFQHTRCPVDGLHAKRLSPPRGRIGCQRIAGRDEFRREDAAKRLAVLGLKLAIVRVERGCGFELHVSSASSRSRCSSSPRPSSWTVTRCAATWSSTSRSRCCQRAVQNQR